MSRTRWVKLKQGECSTKAPAPKEHTAWPESLNTAWQVAESKRQTDGIHKLSLATNAGNSAPLTLAYQGIGA
jgi:hypothetical protein